MANNLGVSTYTIGGDYDTWGTKFVADMAILNKLAGDVLTKTDVAGPIVLTVVECQNFAIKTSGAGGTTVDYRVPDAIARYWFANNARATGSVTYRCVAGGTSVTLLAGQKRLLYSDGTDVIDLFASVLLDVEDQTLTGGARVTSKDLGTPTNGSTVTLDPGDRPLQHLTNNVAGFTLNPGVNTGSFILDITNGATAGAITTAGWTKVEGAFTTTNAHKFTCVCKIGNAGSLLTIVPMQ